MGSKTFGSFLTEKRLAQGISLRGFAAKLDISPVYMCNLEKDRKAAPAMKVLEQMVTVLALSGDDKNAFYDLAAKTRNAPSVAWDLPEYINERDIVRAALRTAKDVEATDEEWLEFIERLKSRVVSDADTAGEGGR
jgi:transcriptional regulator with XRE-family HTH domain